MRRVVVDSNMLRSERLREYLARGPDHFVVLPDYAAIEAYKGDTLQNVYAQLAILSEYPSQVIVLKNTQPNCAFKGRAKLLPEILISRKITGQFAKFCGAVKQAKAGNTNYQRQLVEHGKTADAHLQTMLDEAWNLIPIVEIVTQRFTAAELQIIRTNGVYTLPMIEKFVRTVGEFYDSWASRHPYAPKNIRRHDLPNTFIFRAAVYAVLLVMDWVSKGGPPPEIKHERLRNDQVDAVFATYATYFDGLLTADKKVKQLYGEAVMVLKKVFGVAAGFQP